MRKISKAAKGDAAKLDDAMASQSFAVEGSISSAATSRAHSFEAGEPSLAHEAGAPGKTGPIELKGHSRSRSWVAAVTAPFSRSASGALRPSEEVTAPHKPQASCFGLRASRGLHWKSLFSAFSSAFSTGASPCLHCTALRGASLTWEIASDCRATAGGLRSPQRRPEGP